VFGEPDHRTCQQLERKRCSAVTFQMMR
jgi:hypothetical protein